MSDATRAAAVAGALPAVALGGGWAPRLASERPPAILLARGIAFTAMEQIGGIEWVCS